MLPIQIVDDALSSRAVSHIFIVDMVLCRSFQPYCSVFSWLFMHDWMPWH